MRTICVLAVALVLSTAARAAAEPPDVDAARHSLLWATRSDYRLAINLRRIGSVVALLGLTTATFAGLTYLTARAMCGASDFASSIGAGFGAGSGDGTVANGSGQVTGGGGQVAGTRPASPSSSSCAGRTC